MQNVGVFLIGLAALIFAVTDRYVSIGYLNMAKEQWEQTP